MTSNNSNSEHSKIFLSLIKLGNHVNYHILTKKIKTIHEIKQAYSAFIKKYKISPQEMIEVDGTMLSLKQEMANEVERQYSISLRFFKANTWGEFAKLNQTNFPQLSKSLIDGNGDLIRTFDDFPGTVAMMDFHGYTQFSNDVKYNKTPLKEFGDEMPQKLEIICRKFNTVIYELEGDALVLVGPENPYFITSAVLSIIELAKQKPLVKGKDPKATHGVNINNPVIKKFEMNAAIVTGGETFINNKGKIIGTIVAEASRMLTVMNMKHPTQSGILVSDKVYRAYEKYKEEQVRCHINIFDFNITSPFLVDVKGIRLNVREVYLEEKDFRQDIEGFNTKINQEIKKKSPTKWFNIIVHYIRMIMATINNVKVTVTIGEQIYNTKTLSHKMYHLMDTWLREANPEIIRELLIITNELYRTTPEVREVTAIYHDFINENYTHIADKLDAYFDENLRREEEGSPSLKKILIAYDVALQKIKDRVFQRRIIETILSDPMLNEKLYNTPYIGKK
ncbi:MAG: hypothetical protein II707_03440 [Spirochaetales bacterium]|nr:hypothetical protein [Spirochaetales bacterium]